MRKLKQTIIVAILTGGFALTPSANAKQVRGIEVAPNVVQTENKVGDLQYWDGTKWVLIPSKLSATENSIAPTFALCAGVPTWILYSCPGTPPYQIGETGPAGGRVFHVTEGGLHGLEAAPVDLPIAPWGCEGLAISKANGFVLGTGLANTTAAIAACKEAGTATKLADDYSFNSYSDWYLPSNDELTAMYAKIGPSAPAPLTNVGRFALNGYWSSTEIGANHAWTLFFGNGSQSFGIKLGPLSVRAVRSF